MNHGDKIQASIRRIQVASHISERQSYAVINSDRHGYLFMPIIDWKEWQVWEYIEQHNLPVNPDSSFGNDFPTATDEQVLSWWVNKDKKYLQQEFDFEQ